MKAGSGFLVLRLSKNSRYCQGECVAEVQKVKGYQDICNRYVQRGHKARLERNKGSEGVGNNTVYCETPFVALCTIKSHINDYSIYKSVKEFFHSHAKRGT